jgi:hypothetical protein
MRKYNSFICLFFIFSLGFIELIFTEETDLYVIGEKLQACPKHSDYIDGKIYKVSELSDCKAKCDTTSNCQMVGFNKNKQQCALMTSNPCSFKKGSLNLYIKTTGAPTVAPATEAPTTEAPATEAPAAVAAPTAAFQVTEDWAAQTETSDWAAASAAPAEQAPAANTWGGSSQW